MKGCVGTLHARLEDWERFAQEVYGAEMLSLEDLETWEGARHAGTGARGEGPKAKI